MRIIVFTMSISLVLYSMPVHIYGNNFLTPPDASYIQSALIGSLNGTSSSNLRKAGFKDLGGGYFFKPGAFLVHLAKTGTDDSVRGVYTSIPWNSDKKIIAVDLDNEKFIGTALKIIYEDGSYELKTLGGSGSSGEKVDGNVYSAEELRLSTPVKDRLVKNGFKEIIDGSGVYEILLQGGDEGKAFVVYQNEEILFVCGEGYEVRRQVDYSQNPRIVGYGATPSQLSVIDKKLVEALHIQAGALRYRVDTEGYYTLEGLDTSVELDLPLSEDQNYTEEPNEAGFRIGGVNSNEVIDRLTELNDVPIEEIERHGRPGKDSRAGFLGVNESLIQRLKIDNEFALSDGFTHQQLAEPLFYVMNIIHNTGSHGDLEFQYKGSKYKAHYTAWRGSQNSIFNDGIGSSVDYTVTNVETGASVTFSAMIPFYIWRYGFYEGNTPYRVAPEAIIKCFYSDKVGELVTSGEADNDLSKPQDLPASIQSGVMNYSAIDRRIDEIPKHSRPGIGFTLDSAGGEAGILKVHSLDSGQGVQVTNVAGFTAENGNVYVKHLNTEKNYTAGYVCVTRTTFYEVSENELPIQVAREFGLEKEELQPNADLMASHLEGQESASRFVIGGVNSNAAIDQLTEITGIPIAQIEERARPGRASVAGFLGAEEKLKDRLKTDNDFVLLRGYTHQQLAEPLFYAMSKLKSYEKVEFDYNGQTYRGRMIAYRGMQESIFNDGYMTGADYTVTNVATGASIRFSGLIPRYINDYGFYEGNTSYRVEPQAIIACFLSETQHTITKREESPSQSAERQRGSSL